MPLVDDSALLKGPVPTYLLQLRYIYSSHTLVNLPRVYEETSPSTTFYLPLQYNSFSFTIYTHHTPYHSISYKSLFAVPARS